MATLSSLVVKLKLDAGEYQKGLDDAEQKTRGFGSAIGGLQTVGKVALGATMVAGAAAVGGVVAVMSSAIPLAADFQSQVARLGIAAKESGLSFDQLHDAALQVGGDSQLVGVSATSAADAMTGLFKAGLSTTEVFGDLQGYMAGTAELGGALRGAIDLAAATELDMVQASDLAAVALATFGGEMETEAERAEFINRALNNLVQAADASVADVTDLAMAMKNVGPAASGLGISIEDTNNALAILSTRGISGAEAGTALKSMLTNLQRPTAAVQETLDELGVSLFNASGEFVGLPNLVGQLQTAFAGLTDEERNLAAQTIAGTYGLSALNTLVGEGVDGWNAMADATASAAGIQEQASTMANTFAGRMEALQGTVETLKIGLGEAFLPVAQRFVEWITGIVETHGPAIAAVVGRIVDAFVSFVEGLSSGEDLVGDFANLFYELAQVFGATEEQAKNLFMQVREIGNTIMEVLEPVIQWIKENVELKDVLIALGVAIASVIIPVLVSIISAVAPVIAIFLVVMATVVLLRKAWETNFLGIRDKTNAVLTFIRNLVETVVGWITQFWQQHGEQILATAELAWEGIKNVIDTVMSIIQDIQAAFQAAFEGDWYAFGENLRKAWDKAWEFVKTAIENAGKAILTILGTLITNIIEKFRTTDWGSVGRSIINGIANGIKNNVGRIISAAKNAAKAAFDAAMGFLKSDSPSKLFMQLGRDTMLGFEIGLSDTSGVERAMLDMTNALVGANKQATNGMGPLTVYGDLVLSGVQGPDDLLQQLRDMQ